MQVDVRDTDLIPGSGRPPGGGNSNPLQYSCLGIQRRLVGYSPWGHEELETTEQPSTHSQHDPISTFIIFSVAHLFQDTHGKKESPEASPARAWQTGVGAPAPGCPAVWAHLRGSCTSWFTGSWFRVLHGTRTTSSQSFTTGAKTQPQTMSEPLTQGNITVPGDTAPSPRPRS